MTAPGRPQFAVVGCSDCSTVWIVENLRESETAACPGCRREHQTEKLRALAQADDRHAICELRARILAARAEYAEEYESEDGYADQAKRAEAYLDESASDTEAERAEAVLGSVVTIHDHLDTHYGPDREPVTLTDPEPIDEHHHLHRVEADATLGNVVTIDDHLDVHYGPDRDPVTLEVEDEEDERALATAEHADTGSYHMATQVDEFADVVVDSPTSTAALHEALFATDAALSDRLLDAARSIADDVGGDRGAFADRLHELTAEFDVPSAGGLFGSLLVDALADGNAYAVRKLVSQFGGNTFADIRTGVRDVYAGPLSVLRGSDVTPTVAIRLTDGLFDTDAVQRDARERVLEYIAELARGCDVRVVASGLVQTRLVQEHREFLPASVSESTVARLSSVPVGSEAEGVARDALANIHHSETAWDVLHIICEGRTDTARYGKGSALRNDSRLPFGRSRLSQCISTLETNGLIQTEGPQNDRYAIATPAGTAALETLRAKIGQQAALDSFGEAGESGGVSDSPKSCADSCTHGKVGEGGPGSSPTGPDRPAAAAGPQADAEGVEASQPDHRRTHSTGLAPIETLDRWEHHAAVAGTPAGGVGFDDVPIGGVNTTAFTEWSVDRLEDNRSPIYSHSAGELVSGAEYHGPLQFIVCLARSMSSPLAFEQVLTADRLDGKSGDLDALLGGARDILRDKSCLGWLKDAHTGVEYRDALQNARDDLLELTRKLEWGDHSDEQRELRQDIMRNAHGLVGTLTGIYHLLDVDVTRTVRVPGRVSSNMDDSDRRKLQHTMVRTATIASMMGAYTQSRVQFEPRDDKREALGDAPTVDMDNPRGTHIGQWNLVGEGVTDLEEGIRDAFENPEKFGLSFQSEADNFAAFTVDLPMEVAWSRERIAETVRRSLTDRSLTMTRHAVSVMQAFCGSLHDVSKALYYLPSEGGRLVRVDDLKFALSNLPASRIFPDAAGSVKSKIAHALIRSAMPLTQSELVEQADIATQSFRNHRDALSAFGVICETGAGWVVCLTYREVDFDKEPTEEERPDALPWYAILDDEASHRDRRRDRDLSENSLRGALYDAMLVLESVEAFSDPDHSVVGRTYGALTDADVLAIVSERPLWTPLVEVARAFREDEPLSTLADDGTGCINTVGSSTVATIGRTPEQAGMSSFDDSSPVPADD